MSDIDKATGPVWVTKYALTDGVTRYEEVRHCGTRGMIAIPGPYPTYASGIDWYLIEEVAIARAEKMREDKIASLEKQLEKLKRMKF